MNDSLYIVNNHWFGWISTWAIYSQLCIMLENNEDILKKKKKYKIKQILSTIEV